MTKIKINIAANQIDWRPVKVRDFLNIKYGKGLKGSDRKKGSIPVYGSNGIVGEHYQALTSGKTIIIGRKGSVGEIHFSAGPCWPIDTTYFIDEFNGVNPTYIYHLLRSLNLGTLDTSTAIPGINRNHIYAKEVHLPSLEQQELIVHKLDGILPSIRSAQERIEIAKSLVRKFKMRVLHDACTGLLSAEWREKQANQKSRLYEGQPIIEYDWQETAVPPAWSWDYLGNLADMRLGKMLDKAKNKGVPTKYLRNINVRWFAFNLDDLHEIKVERDEREKYAIHDGDVLVCEGGEPGRAAVWQGGGTDVVFQKAIHRVRLPDYIKPEWLVYCLKCDAESGRLDDLFTGSTIKHFTGKSFDKYPLLIPPVDEQKEIIKQVNRFFAAADSAEQAIAKIEKECDRTVSSVLAAAFRGEL